MTKSAGTQTTTTNSTPYNSSYLDDVFGKSQDLYNNNKVNYYGGQTLYQSPWEQAGYQGLVDNSVYGHTGQYTVPAGNKIFENAAYGNYGVSQSPAYLRNLGIADGTTAEQGRMADTSGALSTLGSGQGAYYDRLNSTLDSAVTGNPGTGYLTGAASGSYLNSNPGYQGLTNVGAGQYLGANPSSDYYDAQSGGAYLNSNPANQYFNQTASGAYLGADPSSGYWNDVSGGRYLNSNPYLDSMYNTAADQVARKYQTATAPQADSAYEKAGRYGSGALTNSRSQNEQNLGTTLSGLASDIYGKNYAAERSLQSQDAANASRSYGAERGLMGTAASNLGQAYGAERTLQNQGASQADQAWSSERARMDSALTGADTAWGRERALMNDASTALGSQYNTATANQLTGANYGLQGQLDAYKAGGALDASSLAAKQKALDSLQTGYDQGNRTAVDALGQFRNVIAGNTDPWSSLIKGGEGLSSYGQAGVTDDVNRYYGNAEDDWYNLKNYAELIGQPISGTSTTSQPLKSNWGSTLLGGASTLASAAGSLAPYFGFSDERLKTDIEPIGELDNGLPVYQYRYNWEDGEIDPHVGLMAQDVALVHPDAVLQTPSGYLGVDYERAIRPRRQ